MCVDIHMCVRSDVFDAFPCSPTSRRSSSGSFGPLVAEPRVAGALTAGTHQPGGSVYMFSICLDSNPDNQMCFLEPEPEPLSCWVYGRFG